MSYYYNPLDRACKSVTGAIPRDCEIAFQVYHEESGEVDFSAQTCTLILCRDGEGEREIPMIRGKEGFSIALKFHETGLYFYHFRLDEALFGCGKGRSGVLTGNAQNWQLTVYDESYTTPQWFKGGVMYQIFPDRFHRGEGNCVIGDGKVLREDWGGLPSYRPNACGKVLNNDFFGGNLSGITEKLDYLKELHVSTIYLNPIFEAYSNHRYDTGDYRKIDPLLGTEEDFDRLILEAKKRGIRIILDGVFNHTGDDSRYFNKYGRYDELGAYQSRQSPYADWYTFRSFPNDYESWWGIDVLPAINETSESYQNFILGENGVLKHWLRHGIGGYRLDVADELPDFFLQKLRESVKSENGEAIIIGEVWEDASNKIAYSQRRKYLQGKELDSVMNYPLKDAIISYVLTGNTTQLRETIAMLIDHYPKATLDSLMNILGTHDTPRILTVLGGKQCATKDDMAVTWLSEEERAIALQKVKMAAVLQFTLPGIPCIYYGDEIGMEGYQDPFCRRCYEWNNTEGDLRDFYRVLGNIRTEILPEVFRDGEYREIFADSGCIVYERRKDDRAAYIFVNHSAIKYSIKFKGNWREHLSGKEFYDGIVIDSYSYGIISK